MKGRGSRYKCRENVFEVDNCFQTHSSNFLTSSCRKSHFRDEQSKNFQISHFISVAWFNLWALGLVGLSNWPRMKACPPSILAAMLSALATAPFMPFSAAVRTTYEERNNTEWLDEICGILSLIVGINDTWRWQRSIEKKVRASLENLRA